MLIESVKEGATKGRRKEESVMTKEVNVGIEGREGTDETGGTELTERSGEVALTAADFQREIEVDVADSSSSNRTHLIRQHLIQVSINWNTYDC